VHHHVPGDTHRRACRRGESAPRGHVSPADDPGERLMAVVLVADDEPAITDLIAQALGANGFDVITAHDGARALELVRSERPDIVMLDVMMPGVDGREVTRRIKADPSLRGIPV